MTRRHSEAFAASAFVWVMAAAAALAAAKVGPQLPLPSSCNPLVCECAEDVAAANCTGKVIFAILPSTPLTSSHFIASTMRVTNSE